MQKNEFEKQMQRKMDELKIHPSDVVWQNVEAAITKKNHRKWGWIFFMASLISLLFAGYFLWHQGNSSAPRFSETTLKNIHTPEDAYKHKNKVLKATAAQKDIVLKLHPSADVKEIASSAKENKKPFGAVIRHKGYAEKKGQVKNFEIALTTFSPENSKKIKDDISEIKTEQKVAGSVLPKKGIILGTQPLLRPENTPPVQIHTSANLTTKMDSLYLPMAIMPGKQHKAINHSKTKNIWSWGLAFSGGVSGVPNGLLGSLDKSYSAADALYLSPSPNNQNNTAALPSPVKSSGAFVAGVFIQKNMSSMRIITLGLNYRQFSTTNEVGVKNDSFISARMGYTLQKYHNHYHFLELPITVKIQLNAKKNPLFVAGGVSLSQLIGSNALQFNSATGVYEKENSRFNKIQAGFNAGLSASIFAGRKTSILIGPYIYYGLTKIATAGLYKNQHFTFIGLKSDILFKK